MNDRHRGRLLDEDGAGRVDIDSIDGAKRSPAFGVNCLRPYAMISCEFLGLGELGRISRIQGLVLADDKLDIKETWMRRRTPT